jgi:hypothetical protein
VLRSSWASWSRAACHSARVPNLWSPIAFPFHYR